MNGPQPPPGHDRYLEIAMPEHFLLEFQAEDGTWIEEAHCLSREVERLEDGSYICSSGGSATWIRCVDHRGDHFVHVDGGGERHRYRLVPLPVAPGS